jgi:hypothetical protein
VKGDPVKDFWMEGVVNRYPDYTFSAKVYDIGSAHGIGGGRVSRLQVWRDDREVMSYDRSWDRVPGSRRDRKALKEILAGFPDRERPEKEGSSLKPTARRQRFGFGKMGSLRLGRDRRGEHYERRGSRGKLGSRTLVR